MSTQATPPPLILLLLLLSSLILLSHRVQSLPLQSKDATAESKREEKKKHNCYQRDSFKLVVYRILPCVALLILIYFVTNVCFLFLFRELETSGYQQTYCLYERVLCSPSAWTCRLDNDSTSSVGLVLYTSFSFMTDH